MWNIYELSERTPEMLLRLAAVWEDSVRGSHDLTKALGHFASQGSLVYFSSVKHSADFVVQPYYLGA